MTIPAFTKYPSSLVPLTFNNDMDIMIGEFPAFIAAANDLKTAVEADAATATTQAGIATAQAAAAAASGSVALAAANYKGAWSALTGAAVKPYAVSHLGKFWQLASNLADVTTKTPGTDPEWLSISSPPCVLTAKTSSGTLSATELAGNVVITNTGAGAAINLTLQPGAANYSVEFEVTVAQYLKVTCAGTDPIGEGDVTITGTAIYVRSNVIGSRWKMTWSGGRWGIHDRVGVLPYNE